MMIHRAIFGSLERFIGILVEHFAGAFPTWLSPVQAKVIPVGAGFLEYADQVAARLRGPRDPGRSRYPQRKGGLQDPGRPVQKIPYMLVVGEKEAASGTVAVRHRSRGDLGSQAVELSPTGSSRKSKAAAWTKRPEKALTGVRRVCYDRYGRVRAPSVRTLPQQTRCEEAAGSSRSLASHLVAHVGCSRGCRPSQTDAGICGLPPWRIWFPEAIEAGVACFFLFASRVPPPSAATTRFDVCPGSQGVAALDESTAEVVSH